MTSRSRPAEPRERYGRLFGYGFVIFWVVLDGSVVRTALALGPRGWLGSLCAVVSLVTLTPVWFRFYGRLHQHGARWPDRLGWICFGIGTVASLAGVVLLGQHGNQLLIFLAIAIGFAVPWQYSLPPILLMAGFTYASQWLFPSWGNNSGEALGLAASGIGCAMGRLSEERGRATRLMTQHAHQLEINDERNRMARDIHDILGHSLTVITLKSELASKLLEADPEAARRELTEVQSLSRAALADVRATVNNYRELSLAGELARAANTLETAGVKADLPLTVDVVSPELREVFAWALREGVTNVVRHAQARSCRVLLAPGSIAVIDDGVGVQGPSDGHGISGLRQRCEASGVDVELHPGPKGVGTELFVHARTLSSPLAPTGLEPSPTAPEPVEGTHGTTAPEATSMVLEPTSTVLEPVEGTSATTGAER